MRAKTSSSQVASNCQRTKSRKSSSTARIKLAGSASDATLVETSFEIYPGIRFLTPINAVKKTLKLETAQHVRSKVETPGFPQDTLNTHTFGGVFPGGFTRLVLVADSTDQIVSILLVDSSPGTRVENTPDTTGYHTYNFVSGSGKASNGLQIKHQLSPETIGTSVLVVDTLLIDPEDQLPSRKTKYSTAKSPSFSRQKTGKVLERSRWYVPSPVVNLILPCVGG
jgi:hypothetical protein